MVRRIVAIAITGTLVAFPTTASAAQPDLSFDFDTAPDEPPTSNTWTSGCFTANRGCVTTTGEAALRVIPRDRGTAIRFPDSGSAVIEVPHAASLNPGRDDFAVSALVRLSDDQRKAGANVIQKGPYASAQWKLQVDSGVPSCRVSGRAQSTNLATAEVRAPDAIPTGSWTSVWCVRDGSRLRLFIDGEESDSAKDADVDITNSDPVTVGGKHRGSANDQYRGDLDNVRLTISDSGRVAGRHG